MSAPEYVICLDCESPTYVFEWKSDKIIDIICEGCGTEDPDQFVTQDDFDSLMPA